MKLRDNCQKGFRTGTQIQLFQAIVYFTVPYFQKRWALETGFNSNLIGCWWSSLVK